MLYYTIIKLYIIFVHIYATRRVWSIIKNNNQKIHDSDSKRWEFDIEAISAYVYDLVQKLQTTNTPHPPVTLSFDFFSILIVDYLYFLNPYKWNGKPPIH
jgi:hypothetical protein